MSGAAPGAVPPAAAQSPTHPMTALPPAGFWRRYLAWSLDWLLLAPVLLILAGPSLQAALAAFQSLLAPLQAWLLERMLANPGAAAQPLALAQEVLRDPVLRASLETASTTLRHALAMATLLGGSVAGLYFIGFEASAWRATPGKRLLGLQVGGLDGGRIGLARAGLRFLAGGLSWLSLNLGHAIAGWREDGRALHDLVAGTRVQALTPMPRWGRWLLLAQVALLAGVMLGLVARVLWLLAQLAQSGVG